MLKLLFVITTTSALTMLVKSEISIEWMCKDINLMGNCSVFPTIKDMLRTMSDNSDNYESLDNIFCPFTIVERHSKCVRSYFDSCYYYMTREEQNFFLLHMQPIKNLKSHCHKGRMYKKEFREHLMCMDMMLKFENPCDEILIGTYWDQVLKVWDDIPQQDQQDVDYYELENRYTRDVNRCQFVEEYLQCQAKQVRLHCKPITETFFRQVSLNMWPVSKLLSTCNQLA